MDHIVFFLDSKMHYNLGIPPFYRNNSHQLFLSFFLCGCGFWESFCAFVCWPRARQEMERGLNPEWI
jgi:hypothetical protein